MYSDFYQRNAKRILIAIGVSLALIWSTAESIPPNNNTESWISSDNIDRKTYEDFRHHFGGEELILVALDRKDHSAQFIESLCSRLEALTEIRKVWSPDRLSGLMSEFDVPDEEYEARLRRVSVSEDGQLAGVAAILTPEGLIDRTATMRRVNGVLKFCDLDASQVKMTGAPVIVAELDRLGGKEANQKYFIATILICFGILWFLLKDARPAGLIVLEIVWAFQMTLAIVNVCGGEMNFILDSLPVMVMVFAMAIAIHYIYHAANYVDVEHAVDKTLKSIAWPCFLAMFTTAIGLLSLTNNDIPPVKQFGMATAGGTVIAFLAGLFVTPAVLQLFPPIHLRQSKQSWEIAFQRLAGLLTRRSVLVMASVFCMLGFAGIGFRGFRAEFQPLNFFPSDSKVLTDTNELRDRMANTDSVEVIVDFGEQNLAAGDQIRIVREIEAELLACDRVPTVLSGTTWLPAQLETSHLPALNRFKDNPAAQEFVADGGCMWRVSARIDPDENHTQQAIFAAITNRMREVSVEKNLDIRTTGIAPLIERAQADIFWGFWSSVGTAICFITFIMIATLRSIKLGLMAMIPNVTPLVLVFGTLGWIGIPTDIGTMMTGSIALGIAVDGTFHFLTCYSRQMKLTGRNSASTLTALVETGPPIVQATIVTGIGMLALMLSNFGPTGNFGLLMSVSLGVALIGDLILLPCLLLVFGRDKEIQIDETAKSTIEIATNEIEHLESALMDSLERAAINEALLEIDDELELNVSLDEEYDDAAEQTLRPFLAGDVDVEADCVSDEETIDESEFDQSLLGSLEQEFDVLNETLDEHYLVEPTAVERQDDSAWETSDTNSDANEEAGEETVILEGDTADDADTDRVDRDNVDGAKDENQSSSIQRKDVRRPYIADGAAKQSKKKRNTNKSQDAKRES